MGWRSLESGGGGSALTGSALSLLMPFLKITPVKLPVELPLSYDPLRVTPNNGNLKSPNCENSKKCKTCVLRCSSKLENCILGILQQNKRNEKFDLLEIRKTWFVYVFLSVACIFEACLIGVLRPCTNIKNLRK